MCNKFCRIQTPLPAEALEGFLKGNIAQIRKSQCNKKTD